MAPSICEASNMRHGRGIGAFTKANLAVHRTEQNRRHNKRSIGSVDVRLQIEVVVQKAGMREPKTTNGGNSTLTTSKLGELKKIKPRFER